MNLSKLTFDLGPALAEHCVRVAAFANNDSAYCSVLLAVSTSFEKSSPNEIYDTPAALTAAWFEQMKTAHEKLVTEKIADEAEECEEISSLFSSGVCAGRSSILLNELEEKLKSAATMCGLPRLMKADFSPYAQNCAEQVDGTTGDSFSSISVASATKLLHRAWADANIDQYWFLAANNNSNKQSSIFGVKSISYSVSPDLIIRYRVAFPALLKSELEKKQIVKVNNTTDLVVLRDVTLTFEDDEVMPGDSTQPMVKKYKDFVALFGISSQQLQRSLVKLQKLVDDSMNGLLDENTKVTTATSSSANKSKLPTSSSTGSNLDNSKNNTSSSAPKVNKASIAKLYTDPEAALKDVDLNDADDVTVREYKEKMSEQFADHVIKPGDAGYVYDKRVELPTATEKSEWDDSDDD